jgi:hypothetical protein
MTIFRNTDESRHLFEGASGYRKVIVHESKHSAYDEREFPGAIFRSPELAKGVAVIVAQITEQFNTLRSRLVVWSGGRLLMLDEAKKCIEFEPAMVHLIEVKNLLNQPWTHAGYAKVFNDAALEGAVSGHGAHLTLPAKGPWDPLAAAPPTARCPLED